MYGFRKHWMRHTATVPKGFLRYQVLEILNEKSMSGSEIMTEIANRTNGRWKPSPGSIYPLLAWLQDNGHVKELPAGDSGMKRYELTASGKTLLTEQRRIIEEQRKIHASFREGREGFRPPFLGAMWAQLPSEERQQLRQSMHKLMGSFFGLMRNVEEEDLKDVAKEVTKISEEAARKIEEINERLKQKKSK